MFIGQVAVEYNSTRAMVANVFWVTIWFQWFKWCKWHTKPMVGHHWAAIGSVGFTPLAPSL